MLLTLVPDLNIAALKYAHVHKDHGGPIASIFARERKLPEGNFFEAFANLDENTTGYKQKKNFLYGDAHGMGTAKTKADAVHCAISEALERWAWFSASKDLALCKTLRLDLDPTTSGFAAFPGLGLQGAKKRALFEAAERWTLQAWWSGNLTHSILTFPDLKGVQIVPPIPGVCIAIIWRAHEGLAHYGFAASYNGPAATERARVELQRNRDALEFMIKEKTKGKLPTLTLTERRLRYFAETKGATAFLERVGRQGTPLSPPSMVVDQQVRGPWSQYAHVWRCLFDCENFRETDKEDFFLF